MTQSTLAQRDFSAGIVRGVGPDQIPPNGVRDAIDCLYEADGAAYARGGTSFKSSSLAQASLYDYIRSLGPSLYWPLNATYGITDQSGNGRNGTGQGSISIGTGPSLTADPSDSSTDFNGTTQYITSSYAPFVSGSARAVFAVVKRDTDNTTDTLFTGSGATPPALAFGPTSQSSSGPNSPGTMADVDLFGAPAWSNPSNAVSSNDSYATVAVAGGGSGISDFLQATNFGFSIPSGATVKGIVAEVERHAPSVFGRDLAVRIVKGGVIGAAERANTDTGWPSSDAYAGYGGSSDLWGDTWTRTDINASNFGFAIAVQSSVAQTMGIDHIRMTVYYTTGTTFAPAPSGAVGLGVAPVASQTQSVAFNFDDTANTGELFLGGASQGSNPVTTAYGTPGNFQVGGNTNPFDGKIAHLAFFERELTDQEVVTLNLLATTPSVSAADTGLTWDFDGYFDVGQRTVFANRSTFGVLDSDDETPIKLGSDGLLVPKPSALMESMLFIGGGYIYGGSRKTANYTTGTISLTNGSKTVTGSGTTWNTLVDAGMLLQRGNERVYVVDSVTDATHLQLRDPYEGVTGSSISYTLSPIYKITGPDPYESGEFYAVAANRLLTASKNTLKFSEIQKPHKWTLTAGTPPAEIPNTHDLPEGVRITGIGVIGNTVLILTTGGIWTLTGIPFDSVDSQGNANHRVEVLSRELIAFGQTATYQQTLVVPCLSGIFLIDGTSTTRRISRPLDQLWQEYVDRKYRPGQPAVYNDHLVLPVLSGITRVKDILVARLDHPTEIAGQNSFPYSRMSASRIACPAFAVRYDQTSGERMLLGAHFNTGRLIDCSGWWLPSTAPETDLDGGEAPAWTLVTRDYETGELTDNTVRTVRPRYELEGASAQIAVEYGFGVHPDSGPRIGEVEIGAFQIGGAGEVFEPVAPLNDSGTFGESNGLHPDHGRVNAHTRVIRYRLTARFPRRLLRLRSLETFLRPSKAIRR